MNVKEWVKLGVSFIPVASSVWALAINTGNVFGGYKPAWLIVGIAMGTFSSVVWGGYHYNVLNSVLNKKEKLDGYWQTAARIHSSPYQNPGGASTFGTSSSLVTSLSGTNYFTIGEREGVSPDIEDAGTVIGPVFGFRGWWVREGYLTPCGVGRPERPESVDPATYAWHPGTNTAECRRRHPTFPVRSPHSSPGLTCYCGFHLFKDHYAASAYHRGMGSTLLGAVVGWGKVVEHDGGYRVEKAQIVALTPNPSTHRSLKDRWDHRRIAKRYNVPLLSKPSQLQAEAEKVTRWMRGEGE